MSFYRSCATRDLMEMLNINLIKMAMGIVDKCSVYTNIPLGTAVIQPTITKVMCS